MIMPADKLANLMFVIRMALTEFTLAVKKKKRLSIRKIFYTPQSTTIRMPIFCIVAILKTSELTVSLMVATINFQLRYLTILSVT